MKTLKFVLPLLGFVFAFAGAVVSMSMPDPAGYFKDEDNSNACTVSTVPVGCDKTEGILCTISGTTGSGEDAYFSGCSVRIRHN